MSPERCPPGALCPAATDVPISNFGGVAADVVLLVVLGVLWWSAAYRRRVLLRIGPKERLAVVWTRWRGPRMKVVMTTTTTTTVTSTLSEEGEEGDGVERFQQQQQQQQNSGDDDDDDDGMVVGDLLPPLLPFEIEFQRVSLHLKHCGKIILSEVTAQLRGASLTAIMGPSGAGKSSLLSVLAGRAARFGDTSGDIFVNKKKVENLDVMYRSVTGFVPQDDILYSALSVEENLMFSAKYRLPAKTSTQEHRCHVDAAISALGLQHVRRELVGDETNRGISGGEVRKINGPPFSRS